MDSVVMPVTAADREAAAANIKRRLIWQHGGEQPWMDASTASMRLGEQDDHDEVQAFARHRIFAITAQPHDASGPYRPLSDLVERYSASAAADAGGDWVMVPRVPTEAMVSTWGQTTLLNDYTEDQIAAMSGDEAERLAAEADWSAMVAAAPSAPAVDAEPFETAAKAAERVGVAFGEKPPSGERGTNIVWDTAQRCASAIRALKPTMLAVAPAPAADESSITDEDIDAAVRHGFGDATANALPAPAADVERLREALEPFAAQQTQCALGVRATDITQALCGQCDDPRMLCAKVRRARAALAPRDPAGGEVRS